ncbi:DNA-directed DNA polymerase, partial [Tanacetum coccineum]
MEEILYKFIDEGKREHMEMRAFINEFRTTNELLFKERNHSLSELRFEVHELLRVIDNAPISNYEVKGVTTRGGKTTTQDIQNDNTSMHTEERLVARLEEACTITMIERCSTVLLNKLPSKEKDPGSFTIPCDIRQLHINNALADLGASITLMSYTMYEKLGLGEPKPTRMSLELVDRSIQYPSGIIENVLIKVDKFILPVDFVILDMPEDFRVPIILGRPFLATSRALIDVFNKKITLRIWDDEVKTARHDGVESEHLYSASANEIDEKKPKLKILPHYLEYAYLHGDKSFLIIISSKLSEKEKMLLLQILIEDDFKPVIQPQRRLNPKVKDLVKNKIVKLLDSRLIYLISDSSWVSPIYVVPKKGGMTVVLNDDNELTPRTVTGWRVCIDYRKLNDDSSKFQSHPKIKKRQHSLVLMGLFLIDKCHLDYAIHLQLFKDAPATSQCS